MTEHAIWAVGQMRRRRNEAHVVQQDGEHIYLSTACLHGQHGYCKADTTGTGGPKIAARCKFCPAGCVCDCHEEETE
jgi:uncharacterized protein YfaP (DUF2135 family)